jgi:hypothetical protein
MRLTVSATLFLSVSLLAAAASAQPRPGGSGTAKPAPATTADNALIAQYDADQLAKLFTAAGFSSKVVTTKDNQRIVQAQFWPNTPSGAEPAYCKNDGSTCNAYKLVAIINNETSIGDAWTDAWNAKYYFVRAYKDGNDLVFTWDVLLYPGVSADYIKTTATVFKSIVDDSTDFKP